MAIIQAVLLATALVSAFGAPHEVLDLFSSHEHLSTVNPFLNPDIDQTFQTTDAFSNSQFSGVAGNPRCGKNEVFRACGPRCTVTCTNYRTFSCSISGCRPGCFCLHGMVRDARDHRKCVRPYKCHMHHTHKDRSSSGSSEEHSYEHHHHKKDHKGRSSSGSSEEKSDEHHHHKKDHKNRSSSGSSEEHSDEHHHHKKDHKARSSSGSSEEKSVEHHYHKKDKEDKKNHKQNNEKPQKKNEK